MLMGKIINLTNATHSGNSLSQKPASGSDVKDFERLERGVDEEESTHTDWHYWESVLEWLQDFDCLTEKGKRFRFYIWQKYVRGKERWENV